MLVKLLLFLGLLATTKCKFYTPIVIWHGLADTCCGDTITGTLQKLLLEYLPGSHVLSLQIGNSPEEDYNNSLTMHPDKQIEIACNIIKSDPALTQGYNAIGYSQGGHLMRALLQRCPEARMKKLITLASPHQGIYGVPRCDASNLIYCDLLRRALNQGIYSESVQKSVALATVWHNPLNRSEYLKGNTYLTDINNENSINYSYIKNLQNLEKFVMVKYEADISVQHIESTWFGFYKDGQAKESETLRESNLYKFDRLGLKQMDSDGKLDFLSNSWEHTDFEWTWFRDNIVDKYLK